MIGLDEQMAYQREPWGSGEHEAAILASLKELKRIKELMREPSEKMNLAGEEKDEEYCIQNYTRPCANVEDIFIAMSAVLIAQVERERGGGGND
jgi:hypothetical protein